MHLEKHLVLNKYFINLFGLNDFNQLREKLKDLQEGYDSNGRSLFVGVLIGLKPEWETKLVEYDSEIKSYVKKLRENRKDPKFNLKYFQYLAVLFTEIFLDNYYNNKQSFLRELNTFLEEFNRKNKTKILSFTEEDIRKIAFWMATGSGKTLIMHINYWQILKYSKNNWDNIILVTPNEGLSKQHYQELKLSGIPCKLYDGNIDNLATKDKEILIVDIHKLTKEKKGTGVRIDISYFEGKNLVFIDEGHKGQKSEEQTWKKLREELAKNGFVFEYSATFGQIIQFNKNGTPTNTSIELYNEYTKAIIFNYSYKYFYTDGYGKDFYVYNIQAKKGYSEAQQELLLTAGLLSFYEQLEIFEAHQIELREYNVEKPLWIFVGSKVTGKGINSDVIKVIKFLNKITMDENLLMENIKRILEGNTEQTDNSWNEMFQDKFEFIRQKYNTNYKELIKNIYGKVFGGRGNLKLFLIKNADGELALKTSGKYFGVINIGDVRELKKLIETEGIKVEEDHLSQSLFHNINASNSSINILIGSKKFVEGWNSWRVSNMCLINMGKSAGTQIIQLFGRGVRLKGKNFSLKREKKPEYKIKTLQTLFIFGLNANYINAFLTTIEKEDINHEEITIEIKFNAPDKWEEKIYTIKTKDDFDFLKHPVALCNDENILNNIKLDLRPRISVAHGVNTGNTTQVINEPVKIPEDYWNILDWNYIYTELMNYKIAEEIYNLGLDYDTIKSIVKTGKYKIFIADTEGIKIENNTGHPTLKITSFEGIAKFHDLILTILKNYIRKFYRKQEKQIMMKHLEAKPLTRNEHSMFPEGGKILLKVPRSLVNDINEISQQITEWKQCNTPEAWTNWKEFIIHFDKHLYTPLIVWQQDREEIKSVPVKLNKGETKFIKDLKNYLKTYHYKFKDTEVFLLRNLSRKGIGFFINSGFYPDFILWVIKKNTQHIVFIDPKGIRNLGNFNDDKIKFCTEYIQEIEEQIRNSINKDLKLHAFIISTTKYDDVKQIFGDGNHTKEDFEEHNIIFQEDNKYVCKIFETL